MASVVETWPGTAALKKTAYSAVTKAGRRCRQSYLR